MIRCKFFDELTTADELIFRNQLSVVLEVIKIEVLHLLYRLHAGINEFVSGVRKTYYWLNMIEQVQQMLVNSATYK